MLFQKSRNISRSLLTNKNFYCEVGIISKRAVSSRLRSDIKMSPRETRFLTGFCRHFFFARLISILPNFWHTQEEQFTFIVYFERLYLYWMFTYKKIKRLLEFFSSKDFIDRFMIKDFLKYSYSKYSLCLMKALDLESL